MTWFVSGEERLLLDERAALPALILFFLCLIFSSKSAVQPKSFCPAIYCFVCMYVMSWILILINSYVLNLTHETYWSASLLFSQSCYQFSWDMDPSTFLCFWHLLSCIFYPLFMHIVEDLSQKFAHWNPFKSLFLILLSWEVKNMHLLISPVHVRPDALSFCSDGFSSQWRHFYHIRQMEKIPTFSSRVTPPLPPSLSFHTSSETLGLCGCVSTCVGGMCVCVCV